MKLVGHKLTLRSVITWRRSARLRIVRGLQVKVNERDEEAHLERAAKATTREWGIVVDMTVRCFETLTHISAS